MKGRPTMSERGPERVTCVDTRTHEQPQVLKLFILFLQMTAAAGALVLLFAAQAVITVWSGCASATRSLRACMTLRGRDASHRLFSWRRALYVFYLGTASGWSAGQASWNSAPERDPLPAEVRASSTSSSRMKLQEGPVGTR